MADVEATTSAGSKGSSYGPSGSGAAVRLCQVVLSTIAFSVTAAISYKSSFPGATGKVTISFDWTDFDTTVLIFTMGLISCFFALLYLCFEITGIVMKVPSWDPLYSMIQTVTDYILTLLVFGASCSGSSFASDTCGTSTGKSCTMLRVGCLFLFFTSFSFMTSFWMFLTKW